MTSGAVQIVDGVLETVVSTEDVERVCGEVVADENTKNIRYSKTIWNAFLRARKAGAKRDALSRKIVAAQREKREAGVCGGAIVPVRSGQQTIFDFVEVV